MADKKNVKLTIEYKGTTFCGWQSQSMGSTIQDAITEAIFKTTGAKVNLIAAGRTDAGVHALGQVANFIIEHTLPASGFKDALNYYLPEDIRIQHASEVPLDFHARYDALFKRYRYLVGKEKSALYRDFRWECSAQLDITLLVAAAKEIVGEHDFTPFCVVSSLKENNVCRIDSAKWRRIGPLMVFEIRGNRFLHSMIRSLVGAMVNLATLDRDKNKLNLTLDRFQDIMKASTTERSVFTAPAQGLYLVSVGYDKEKIG